MENQRRRARLYAAHRREQLGRAPSKLDESIPQAEIDAFAKRRVDAAEEQKRRREEFRREMVAHKRARTKGRQQARHQAMQLGDEVLPQRRLKELHLASQEDKCAHCGTSFDSSDPERKPELDHKVTLRTALTRREVANNVNSRHTADNTWVICAACHQAKTCIENSSHICVKHRWKMTWIGRSKDGQWHLPHLEEQADTTCGWCLRCKLITASYLIRPRQILSWEKSNAHIHPPSSPRRQIS